jgi:hypothetical protein
MDGQSGYLGETLDPLAQARDFSQMRAVATVAAGSLAMLGFTLVGVANASTVGTPTVSLSSTAASGTEVTYTVSFTATGGLTGAASTIDIAGPSGTVFPTSSSCGGDYGVAVNGGATVQCGATVSGGGTNSVTITDPTTATAGQSVTVTINGVANSSSTGAKDLSVSTSADTTVTNAPFTLFAAQSVSSPTLGTSSTSVNATNVTYTEEVTASSRGAMTGGFSTFTVSAPSGTAFPSSDSCGGDYTVSVNGGAGVSCGAIVVSGGGSNTIVVTDPTSSTSGDQLMLTINGVSNSGTAGSQSVDISTSSDTVAASQSLVLTAETSMSAVGLQLTSTSAGATEVTYTLTGTLTNGLTAGVSTFTFAAPAGTSFPSDGSCGGEFSAKVGSGSFVTCGANVVSGGGTDTVTFNSPVTAASGDHVTVVITGVSNTANPGDQPVDVSSSSDPAAVTEFVDFTATSMVTGLTAFSSSTAPSAGGVTYTVTFTSTNGMTAGVSTLTLTTPAGTVLPASGSCGGDYAMRIGSGSLVTCGSTVVSGGGTNNVVVHTSVSPAAGQQVTVLISGVTNPPSTTSGDLSMSTSSDPGTAITTLFGGSPPPAPTTTVTSPIVPVQVAPTITITYTATDQHSAIASYDLRYRSASWNGKFGAYNYPKSWQHTTHTTKRLRGKPGHEYCFDVRSRNATGQVSGWTRDWCRTLPLDDRAFKAITSGWLRRTGSHFYKHTITRSTRRGAKLRLKEARVHQLALIVKECPTCGMVQLSFNGFSRTVNTHANKTRCQAIVLLPAVRERVATVTVEAKGPHVFIDGIAIIEK